MTEIISSLLHILITSDYKTIIFVKIAKNNNNVFLISWTV